MKVGDAALDVESTSGTGTLLARPVTRKNPWKNPRLIAAGGVLLAIVTFLIFNAMGSSMAYFHTVSELRATTADPGERMRLGGKVVPGSVERVAMTDQLRFTITDGQQTMDVSYQGVVPDIFNEEVEVVAEGNLDANGVFVADHLLTKCPSRFEAEGDSNASTQ